MRRNEQLTLLDDRFEKFYEQFDDDEIGALDNAELEGKNARSGEWRRKPTRRRLRRQEKQMLSLRANVLGMKL
ncbi:hypothetical protein KUCAC02_022306 [Chaenocephalus aceratus]|uniref:Uncharacterized protein n=1 Tax=Chaenocephalus aceratus TaxID=36190 RepID=A0ACB9XLP0_CHAAC|nr:hypothetical protein KUCAC02_022306 [Chaenocephalus aceratus]